MGLAAWPAPGPPRRNDQNWKLRLPSSWWQPAKFWHACLVDLTIHQDSHRCANHGLHRASINQSASHSVFHSHSVSMCFSSVTLCDPRQETRYRHDIGDIWGSCIGTKNARAAVAAKNCNGLATLRNDGLSDLAPPKATEKKITLSFFSKMDEN